LFSFVSSIKIKKAWKIHGLLQKKPSAVFGLPTATFKKISGHERGRQTPLKKPKKTKKLSACMRVMSIIPSFYSITYRDI
jgi:hypothetical protein